MNDGNRFVSRTRATTRERLEFSLDGRQVAAVAVGALVIVGSAFVLGMNVGKQVGRRPADVASDAALAALDEAHDNLPAPPEPRYTFHPALTGERAPDPAATAPAPAHARVPPPARPLPPRPTEESVQAAAAPAATAPAATAPAAATTPPAPTAEAAPSPMAAAVSAVESRGAGLWTIQVGASPSRAEAEKIARRHAGRGAAVIAADVDGKRWYRVRLGGYPTRTDAELGLQRLSRETGTRGFVTAAR